MELGALTLSDLIADPHPGRAGPVARPARRDAAEFAVNVELGIYSFGNTPRTTDGGYGSIAQAIRDVLEAVRVAEEVGLDFFGFGEHHTRSMPLSSPTALVNAAAASTHRIGLGTTVTVLSTDEPIRVYQQLATAAAIAPGRIEAVAGRGSSDITFPIFDLDVSDYDMLYRSKLDLLLALNGHDRVTWNGPHRRRPLNNTARRASARAATSDLAGHRRQPRIGSPPGPARPADVPRHPRRHPRALSAIRPRLPQRLGGRRPSR
jgi:hypothetical protein